MTHTLSAIFPSRRSAEHAAADLQRAGFARAQIDLMPQEHSGPTDVVDRLRPTSRSVTGAIVGALVLGAVGWLAGWSISLVLRGGVRSSNSAAIISAICGVIVGCLAGALLATHVPVEGDYYREERLERGVTRLSLNSADREEEARRILGRNGARFCPGEDLLERPSGYGADSLRGASG
jgi:hypothetical protein